jgi:hypothetical protein
MRRTLPSPDSMPPVGNAERSGDGAAEDPPNGPDQSQIW